MASRWVHVSVSSHGKHLLPALWGLLLFLKEWKHRMEKAFPQQHCWHSCSFHHLHFSSAAAIMSPGSRSSGRFWHVSQMPTARSSWNDFWQEWQLVGHSNDGCYNDQCEGSTRGKCRGSIRHQTLCHVLQNTLWSAFLAGLLLHFWWIHFSLGLQPGVFHYLFAGKHFCNHQMKGSKTKRDLWCVLSECLGWCFLARHRPSKTML